MTPTLSKQSVVRATVVLLVVALVVPFVVFAVPQLAGADASYVVLTGSMEPKIGTGDAVVVADVPARTIAAGDVITFARPGETTPTTHRVLEVTETNGGLAWITKGDNNEDADAGFVTPDMLVGRVAVTLPLVGHVVTFANTPVGIATLVIAPFGLFVATEAVAYRRAAARADGDPETGGSDEPGAGDGDWTGPATDSVEEPWLSVSGADLRSTAVVLGLAAVYAAAIAVLVYDGSLTYIELLQLTAAGAAAFGVALLVVLAVRYLGADATPTAASTDEAVARSDPVAIIAGRPDAATRDLPRVTVTAAADLERVAATVDAFVVADGDRRYVCDGSTLYVHDAVEETDDQHDLVGGDLTGESIAEETSGEAPVNVGPSPADVDSDADAFGAAWRDLGRGDRDDPATDGGQEPAASDAVDLESDDGADEAQSEHDGRSSEFEFENDDSPGLEDQGFDSDEHVEDRDAR
jgi:signal peptidase